MTFIERHLMPGEVLVYHTRYHWARLLPAMVLMVLACAALVAVVMMKGGAWAYVPLALVVVAALKAIGAYVAFSTAEFGVTTERVMVKKGLFTLRSTEILIPKVEAIQVEQNIWGRIFGYGTVTIIGTGGTQEVFQMIEAPYELRNQVQAQLTETSRGPKTESKPEV